MYRVTDSMFGIKRGFSIAEMLIVLLIISFLVLALPPVVHKTVAKKIVRGEHGRFECWIDPADGETYEFYATEKSGAKPEYLDAAGNPKGKKVENCTFDPVKQAPNAAYFSFQAIGGGAGGSYPPYDPTKTMYKDTNYDDESVKITLSNTCCSNTYRTNCKQQGCDTWGKYCNYPEEFRDFRAGNESAKCYNYSISLQTAYDTNQYVKSWLYKYWQPVPPTQDIKICSGKGFTGTPIATEVSTLKKWVYSYGGPGGSGVCFTLNRQFAKLDQYNRFKVVNSDRMEMNKFFKLTKNSTEYLFSDEYQDDAGNIAQNPNPPIDVPQQGEGWSVHPECYGYPRHGVPHKNAVRTGNTCRVKRDPETLQVLKEWEANYVSAYMETDLAGNLDSNIPRCDLLPGSNSAPGGDPSYGAVSSEEIHENPLYKAPDTTSMCTAPWVKAEPYDEVKVATTVQYPNEITITRHYGFDTPTYGYAGVPGESLSMFLPKMQEVLSFEIGDAGIAGTATAKSGGDGGDTVVKSEGREIFRAKGGRGVRGGEAGGKVFLFGNDVFLGRPETPQQPEVLSVCEIPPASTDPMTWNIDGCLDVGVARDSDAEKRFAENSGFYTILELNADSKTPSAINYLYGNTNTMLPGSAGDGGYSFLRNTSGEEYVTYTNFPEAAPKNWTYQYENTKDYQCYKKNDVLGSPTGEIVSYPETVCKPTEGYPGAVIIVW